VVFPSGLDGLIWLPLASVPLKSLFLSSGCEGSDRTEQLKESGT
jgi:hypothetical protein